MIKATQSSRPSSDDISLNGYSKIRYIEADAIFVCTAKAGSNKSDPVWQIKKVSIGSTQINDTYPDGNPGFIFAADRYSEYTYV